MILTHLGVRVADSDGHPASGRAPITNALKVNSHKQCAQS